jgi:ATP-dependent RNA helicase RhlE
MHFTINNFQELGVAPKLVEHLTRNRYTIPTPIQQQCIPLAIERKDIIGIAQTGTGKTLAFAIPMLQSLAQEKSRGLIVVPTRELAIQAQKSIADIAHGLNLRTVVLIGGEAMSQQLKQLKLNPAIVIATPGRLIDHLEQGTISLDAVHILVLDEADRMLDMGFEPQIRTILEHVPRKRQTMLFSATMPPAIVNVASRYMRMPVQVEVARSGTTVKEVSQELFFVELQHKKSLLENVLAEYHGSILVFTRTKFSAKKLTRLLRSSNHRVVEIHSDRSQMQRREAMEGFKIGKYRILVATDIAARGLDVSGIELVVNYDLPSNGEDYVHRIGRTARAGAVGHAISFAMPHQRKEVRAIEDVIRMAVRVSPLPGLVQSHGDGRSRATVIEHPAPASRADGKRFRYQRKKRTKSDGHSNFRRNRYKR